MRQNAVAGDDPEICFKKVKSHGAEAILGQNSATSARLGTAGDLGSKADKVNPYCSL